MRFWLDMGVDGFREDVITFIGKTPGLPNSYPKLPVANGMKHFSNRPEALEYMREFKDDVLDRYDCFVVGESPLTNADTALKYLSEGPDRVLDEMIAFNHMEADCFMTDMIRRPFNLKKMKKAFTEWQDKLNGKAWNALYIENHDHARIISRYGSEDYPVESGKMLAAMYMLQRGTPFIYQGQEIGMLNIDLPDLDSYEDVQTINNAKVAMRFLPKKKVMRMVRESSRDNARTPVQWSSEKNAGFSEAEPWFHVNPNYREINVAAQDKDPDSLLNFYRRLVRFKLEEPVAIWGDYKELCPDSDKIYAYLREYEERKLLVVCSFTSETVRFEAPEELRLDKAEAVFTNYEYNYIVANGFTMRPYEVRVYLFG
jgi:oligo-1,6-glucosidase